LEVRWAAVGYLGPHTPEAHTPEVDTRVAHTPEVDNRVELAGNRHQDKESTKVGREARPNRAQQEVQGAP
jgi:hypothetical protein